MIPVRKDHKQQALDRLLYQFKDKENIEALLNSFTNNVQITEDDLLELLNNSSVYTAVGSKLDDIGKIVGAFRGGRSDESYREHIHLKILLNISNGTPNELLEVLSLLTNATLVDVFEHYPMGANFYTNGNTIPSGLAKTLSEAAPVCCGDIHVYHDPDDNCFIPCELVRGNGILVDADGNEIVDADGNNIAVGGLEAEVSNNSWRGVFPEVDGSIEKYGVFCEVYT